MCHITDKSRVFIENRNIRAISFVFIFFISCFLAFQAEASFQGPAYPPPGGATEVVVPAEPPADGAIGKAGGKTLYFSNVTLAESATSYWGVWNNGVKLSLDGCSYSGPEIMAFDAGASNLPGGIAVWNGQTRYRDVIRGTYYSVQTRFTLTVKDTSTSSPLALTLATDLGLAPDVGAVLLVPAGLEFNIKMLFTNASTGQPVYEYYNHLPTATGQACSSVHYGFYYNYYPTISDITDKTTLINTSSGPHSFTVGDAESPVDSLVISADSSNTALVDPNDIVFGGTGTIRTVTISPAADQTGTSTITVTVTDSDGGSTSDTFDLMVNNPPRLTANNMLYVDRCESGIITNALLAATDVESGPAELSYLVGPDAGPARNGTLKLNGIDLTPGDTFTQEDIDSNLVTYHHDCNCEMFDDFQFKVIDANEGSAPPPPFTTYTFRIEIKDLNRRPVANDVTIIVNMGITYYGTLSATNDDCVEQTLTFSIVTNGDKGTATIIDANTGAFTYDPNPGEIGADSFTFQVNDGIDYAIVDGNISVSIENQPPVANDDSGTTSENVSFNGTLSSTDVNLPPQALSYSIDTNGSKGSAVITDPSTGDFTYTPDPGAIGIDTFTFTANDGLAESAPATFTITIRPNIDVGDILVTDHTARAIVLIDPNTKDQVIISSGGLLSAPCGLAIENKGTFLVVDRINGLVRVNPDLGQQTLVTSGPFVAPVDVAVESDGDILVTDGTEGVKRFDSSGNLLDTFSGDNIDYSAGIDILPDGTIFVSDNGFFVDSNNKIISLDPITGDQNVITYNGYLKFPIGIDHDSSGNIIVADTGPMAGAFPNSIIKVIPGDGGSQIVLSKDMYLSSPFDVALNNNGDIFVANYTGGSIVKVDPVSGNQEIIASGGNVMSPFSIMVVREIVEKDVSVEMHLPMGWNMISLPVIQNNALISDVLPGAAVVYSYDKAIGYDRVEGDEELQPGSGYWALLYQDQNYVVTGQPIHSYTHTTTREGWEMIGGCTYESKPSTEGCDIGVIYRYKKGIGYQRVHGSENLLPGKGYWILFAGVVDQCKLMVETTESLGTP